MLNVTETAQQKFNDILEAQGQDGWPIRIQIMGRGVDSFAYDLATVRPEMQPDNDIVVECGDLTVSIPPESADMLDGATLDYNTEKNGFQFDNPNPVWTDELGPQIAKLIIEQINPGIAGHGGAMLPVDVRNHVVYIRMFGGCQGCGMANMTLTQGVERSIKEAFPQIEEVVDITHHAAGTNPYYAKTEKGASPAAQG